MKHSKAGQRGGGAPLPPRGPMVDTQAEAHSLEQIGTEWIIVAVRPSGKGEWEPTMPYEEWRAFKAMVDDGAATTTQRRDSTQTVLLARLKGAE